MILFDDIVEVFDLTDLDARLSFGVMVFECRRVGTTLVDRDLLRRSVPLDRLVQEPQRGFAISLGGQQKIHRAACLIDGPIQILPGALDPHIGLVHSPAGTCRPLVGPKLLLQQGDILRVSVLVKPLLASIYGYRGAAR